MITSEISASDGQIDRRLHMAACSAHGISGAKCRALPRYVCTNAGHERGHVYCGVHIQRTDHGFVCPECGARARSFIKRDRGEDTSA